ncbi:unnamed protein product [Colias eurytheme]|nr:unnamed protein product [Colias eurytheme]
MNDDELNLRRKKQNAERARAYRKRKKGLDAMPSTSTVQSGEPASENIVTAKLLHKKQLNAERCRRYRQKCKRLKSGANFNRGTSDSNTSTSRDTSTSRELIVNPEEFQNSSDHPQQFFNHESSPQAPEDTTGNANTSTPTGARFRRYRRRLKTRRTHAEENPSSIYTFYMRHNGAHNLFKTLFEDNPFGFVCPVCDRVWFKNDLKSIRLSCNAILEQICPTDSLQDILVCATCKTSLTAGKIPNLAVHNGFEYPPKPNLTNSVQYWQSGKKDLFAMIRQLGKPTVFLMMSGWKLHYKVKEELINEDAVTCAIYFNKLVNVMMKILQHKTISPFGKHYVQHYFKRIEFQHGGSPHAHILLWLNEAPKDSFGADMNSTIQLIDDLISVSSTEASGNINLVTHHHTFTCYKNDRNQRKCRFNAPFMPSRSTILLKPLAKSTDDERYVYDEYKKRYKTIHQNLENNNYDDIDDFYNKNNISSDEDYHKILSAGISRPMVFVKRHPNEKWHNFFNPFIFHHLQSNMDIQYIIDENSCAAYVAEYVNKSNRGTSNLQRELLDLLE